MNLKRLAQPRGRQCLEIAWQRQAKFADWSQHADGCYLLRSNLTGVDAATLWKRYIQLTEAEWAFRITKDELEIRPVWHQKADRVKAHILVCFLAYVLWKTLAGWMRNAGLGDAPRTLLEDFAKIKSGDATLRARSPAGGVERQITLAAVQKQLPLFAAGPICGLREDLRQNTKLFLDDRLRCVTEPDEAQGVLLHRLGLKLARRLRRLDDTRPNVVK